MFPPASLPSTSILMLDDPGCSLQLPDHVVNLRLDEHEEGTLGIPGLGTGVVESSKVLSILSKCLDITKLTTVQINNVRLENKI